MYYNCIVFKSAKTKFKKPKALYSSGLLPFSPFQTTESWIDCFPPPLDRTLGNKWEVTTFYGVRDIKMKNIASYYKLFLVTVVYHIYLM